MRCYLSETNTPERTLLRQLSRFADKEIGEHDLPEDYIPIDLDDARTVVQAYIDIFTPPLELSLAPIILLDIAKYLYNYVYLLLTNRQRRVILEEMVPGVIRSALARLGLEIDRELEGEMQPQRRVFTRDYAADVFGHMGCVSWLDETSYEYSCLFQAFSKRELRRLKSKRHFPKCFSMSTCTALSVEFYC